MTLTRQIAIAAGHDAATARMRKAGRKTWNIADYNHACRVTRKLLKAVAA